MLPYIDIYIFLKKRQFYKGKENETNKGKPPSPTTKQTKKDSTPYQTNNNQNRHNWQDKWAEQNKIQINRAKNQRQKRKAQSKHTRRLLFHDFINQASSSCTPNSHAAW